MNKPIVTYNSQKTPQATDLEEAVLGAAMLEAGAIAQIKEILTPVMFFDTQNADIFSLLLELDDKQQKIDLLTVTNIARTKNKLEDIGGPGRISELTNKIGSTANIEYHARIIAENWLQREVIKVCLKTPERIEKGADTFDILEGVQTEINNLYQGIGEVSYENLGDLLPQAIHRIEQIQASDRSLIGIPSGNTDLDRMTGGWVDTRFIVVAARPKMGKTTKMMSYAYQSAVKFNSPVAIFSLEQGKIELTNKLLSIHTGISQEKIGNGELSSDEWKKISTELGDLEAAPLYIDSRPKLTPRQIRTTSKRLVSANGVELIMIDYLQIMGTEIKGGNKQQQVTEAAEFCKSLAKELNVPVVGFAQVGRSVEQRGGDRRPLLSDLKESGAIEENADQVLFLYRPEYYGITVEDGEDVSGVTETIIAANRHGVTDTIRENTNMATSSFQKPPF
jgi:replicative DNA helicase